MRKFSVFLGIILFVQILYSCTSPIIPYSIDAKKEDPPLETLINWEGWYTIKAIKPFFAPWDYLEDETVFRCFFSSQYFYFSFNVADATPIMCREFVQESDVEAEDRVEIFFSASKDMGQYYCMEIDPSGHVMDYSASYYRKFDYEWNFKSLEICSIKDEKGYIVAGRLSVYNPQIQISAESETKRSIFREKDKTKRSKKESAQHSKSRNKSFVMTSVSAL